MHPDRLDVAHPFRQWKTWTMPGSGLTLTGYSRANDKTFFVVPELRCGLDAGLAEGRQPEHVFLTHAHLDHAKDLDYLAVREGGVDVYAPAEAVPFVSAYLRAATELNQAAPFDPALAARTTLHGVRPGDDLPFGKRGRFRVRVVECVHKVPCVGYCFAEVRTALLPELEERRSTLPPAEFGALVAGRRKAGLAVDREVRRPLFAYLGDTDPVVFAANPWLFEYPVIVTECTYLDDAQLERAKRVGHTVWSQLRPVVADHPEILFVLIHFSLRHGEAEIVDFFARESLPNVLVWSHPEPALAEQHQRT